MCESFKIGYQYTCVCFDGTIAAARDTFLIVLYMACHSVNFFFVNLYPKCGSIFFLLTHFCSSCILTMVRLTTCA
jgi:hypothetical protein